MDIGVFIPIGKTAGRSRRPRRNTCRPSSSTSRSCSKPSTTVDLALSIIKLRGFGGKSEFWTTTSILHPDGRIGGGHQAHPALCLGRRAHHPARHRGEHGVDHRFDLGAAGSASTSSRAGPRWNTSKMAYGRARRTSLSATTTAPSTSPSCASCGRRVRRLQGPVLPDGRCKLCPRPQAEMKSSAPARAGRHGLRRDLRQLQLHPGQGREHADRHAPTNEAMATAAARPAATSATTC